MCLRSAVLHNKGGPSMPVMHPKRSPTSTGDRELREGRMPSRKASCSVMGSHSLPPSSPMVSSANNPNKSEIPDRRKDMTATTVSARYIYSSRKESLMFPKYQIKGSSTSFFFFLPVTNITPLLLRLITQSNLNRHIKRASYGPSQKFMQIM